MNGCWRSKSKCVVPERRCLKRAESGPSAISMQRQECVQKADIRRTGQSRDSPIIISKYGVFHSKEMESRLYNYCARPSRLHFHSWIIDHPASGARLAPSSGVRLLIFLFLRNHHNSAAFSGHVRLQLRGCMQHDTALALQLHIPFDMSFSSAGLICASPDGPSNDVGGIDPSLRKADGDATDFLDRPADQWRRGFAVFDVVFRRFVFGGGVAFA